MELEDNCTSDILPLFSFDGHGGGDIIAMSLPHFALRLLAKVADVGDHGHQGVAKMVGSIEAGTLLLSHNVLVLIVALRVPVEISKDIAADVLLGVEVTKNMSLLDLGEKLGLLHEGLNHAMVGRHVFISAHAISNHHVNDTVGARSRKHEDLRSNQGGSRLGSAERNRIGVKFMKSLDTTGIPVAFLFGSASALRNARGPRTGEQNTLVTPGPGVEVKDLLDFGARKAENVGAGYPEA
jgi:hypothetical protein